MALPPLYLQNLILNARRDVPALNTYKVGLMEAILREALRQLDRNEAEAARSSVQTALDVARWEPPRKS